jgi:tetratricopeptide (TPR) repeat protein
MGDLVPYGELWRAGANKNTMINFSNDVILDGTKIAKGNYALFIRPGKTLWEVFFYSNTENSGLPKNWNTNLIVAVAEVVPHTTETTWESFTISIDDLNNTGATLNIKWENTEVKIPFKVPTDKKTMASIKEIMKGSPKSRDYYSAAIYYRETGKDLRQAKKWIAKAIDLDEGKYWMYRQQSLILAELKETEAAIVAAKTSLKLAKEAGNNDYIRLNTKSIEEWSK